jgi:hypothetical protein
MKTLDLVSIKYKELRFLISTLLLASIFIVFIDFRNLYSSHGLMTFLKPEFFIFGKYNGAVYLAYFFLMVFTVIGFMINKKAIIFGIPLIILNLININIALEIYHPGWVVGTNFIIICLILRDHFNTKSIDYLLRMFVLLIYFKATLHRLNDGRWLDGEMGFVFVTSGYGRWKSINWIEYNNILKGLTYFSLFIELLAPLMLLKFFRRIWLVLLISLHASIELISDVSLWSIFMIILLYTIFGGEKNEDKVY